MAEGRRVKKTTVAGSLQTIQSISKVLEPTLPLSERERFHYDCVISSREADSWFPVHITTACMLAKAITRLEGINEQLNIDGVMLVTEKGTPIAHPLLSASMTQSNSIQSLTRTLGLSASQRGMSDGEQDKRNKADKVARAVIQRASEDDLLA